MLVITALLLPSGRLGDYLGRERVFTSGIGVTIVGSALCGVAQSEEQLILFRVLQGVGGAMILGNHQALIAGAFVPLTRNLGSSLSVGVFSAVFASRIVAYGQGSADPGVLADPAAMVMALRDTFVTAGIFGCLSVVTSLCRGSRESSRGPKAG